MGVTREKYIEIVGILAESVYDFHERFELNPVGLDEIHRFESRQLGLLLEESAEFAKEVHCQDTELMMEELADVAFVALGGLLAAHEIGMSGMIDVAYKNDNKSPSNTYIRNDGKVVKHD